MNISELYDLYLENPSVETDTRKIKPGDIFVALKGPNFNGNAYAGAALEAGASYCIVDESVTGDSNKILQVEDCLATLQSLAKKHREQFTIPFIAITGSNGKTTTKELVHAVLSSTYRTYTTTGNLNNHIGVPLTILKIKKDAQFAVVEMGANHLEEIAGYCKYAMPTHGLITNCGKAHLEGFGSEEAIKVAKGELFDYLRAHQGTAFVNQDYDYLHTMSAGLNKIIWYGTGEEAAYAGNIVKPGGLLQMSMNRGANISHLQTQLVGDYNLPNILAAITVGKTFNVPDEVIKISLENYRPSNSRSQLLQKDGNNIILDAYNANPSSMKAAIENFAQVPGANKVLLLGAMMELGESSIDEHEKLVALLNEHRWQYVVLVGNDFRGLDDKFFYFKDVAEAKAWYKSQKFKDAQVLIKGSRSMQMEKLLD